jgi:hypothetical protein
MQVKTKIQAGDKIIIEQSNGSIVTQSAGSGANLSLVDQGNYVYLTIIKGGGHAFGHSK